MIQVKNAAQLAEMKEAGRITGEALLVARDMIREGVSTKALDDAIRHHIEKCGARPSFLGYAGFPAGACISINDEIIHGIPSKHRYLQEGDIVKIDVGAFYHGFHGDSANTFGVGKISKDAEHLIAVTRESFYRGVAQIREGARLGDIVRPFSSMWNPMVIPSCENMLGTAWDMSCTRHRMYPITVRPGRGVRLYPGMTIAIEPMVNIGTYQVVEMPDGWTVKTADGSLSAHYEHTIAVTPQGVHLLTKVE